MHIEVLTPDKKVYEGEVDSAVFPGSDGSFQVLNYHAPMVSMLGKGDMVFAKLVDKKQEQIILKVDGGIVEILQNKVTVLAEHIES